MSNNTRFAKLTGLAVAAATLLALTPGVASAADTNVTMPTTNQETIEIASDTATLINGHKFAAVQIGNYDNAMGDSTTNILSNVAVSTVGDLKSAAETALTDSGATANTDVYGGNPVGQVVAGNTSSTTAPYTDSGSNYLRKFVTALAKQSAFTTAVAASTTPTATAANGKADFNGLKPGVYMVEDVTTSRGTLTGKKNSIPMFVETGITSGDSTPVKYTKLGSTTLGTINMKADSPSVSKKILDDSDSSIGSYIKYELTANVPLTTGFEHYLFTMTDQPSAGLKYVDDTDHAPTVKADSTDVPTADYSISSSTWTAGDTDSEGRVGDTRYVAFDLSKYAEDTANYGKTVTIDYYMQISDNATATAPIANGVKLSYSSDPANSPATDKPVLDPDGVPETNGTDCTPGQTTPCNNNKEVTTNDTVAATGGSDSGKIHIKHFTINSEAKADSSLLAGAQFTVTKQTTTRANDPIKFNCAAATADGVTCKQAADQSSNTATSTLTVPGDSPTGAKGKLRIDGLSANATYTVAETKTPNGYSDTFKPTFNVTTGKGDANTYSNTADTLHLGLVNVSPATDPDADATPIVVYAVTGISQLPLTGGAGVALAVIVAVLLLGTAGCLYALKRRQSNASAAASATMTL